MKDLGVRYIIHAVGPRYSDYNHLSVSEQDAECRHLIAKTYRKALQEAERRELESIALPAISSG